MSTSQGTRKRTTLTTKSNATITQGKINDTDPGVRASQSMPVLLDYPFILSMVLGGCCTNVWAYEQLLILNPRIGSFLTFAQMAFIAVQSLPAFLVLNPNQILPRLKPRQVPLSRWALHVVLSTSNSLLNNWAFAYDVPLSVFIVFRSAGLAISMLFGFLFLKKRYSIMQITSVAIVTAGVVLATLSRPSKKSASSTSAPPSSDDIRKYSIGVAMLVVSSILTGLLGLSQERTYKKYGPCWKEGVFYSNFLSLPISIFFLSDIKQGISNLSNLSADSSIAISYLILAINLVTQLICVSGVNRLTSQVSSVSTNLVLTTRKAISLCFSVWWFGNGWNIQLGVGASMVFLGSLLFTVIGEAQKGRKKD